MKNRGRNVPTG